MGSSSCSSCSTSVQLLSNGPWKAAQEAQVLGLVLPTRETRCCGYLGNGRSLSLPPTLPFKSISQSSKPCFAGDSLPSLKIMWTFPHTLIPLVMCELACFLSLTALLFALASGPRLCRLPNAWPALLSAECSSPHFDAGPSPPGILAAKDQLFPPNVPSSTSVITMIEWVAGKLYSRKPLSSPCWHCFYLNMNLLELPC